MLNDLLKQKLHEVEAQFADLKRQMSNAEDMIAASAHNVQSLTQVCKYLWVC
jgi:hypothetical protein